MIRLSKILVPLLVVLAIIIAGWGITPTGNDEPCIVKQSRWNPEKQETEHLWKIEGHWYLVKETPHGQMEIVGLYSRYE